MEESNEILKDWQKDYLNYHLGFSDLIDEFNNLFELFVIFNEEEYNIDYYWVLN